MAGITFGGIASGLDTNAIITQLLQLESRPLQRLDSQRADIVQKQGRFGEFKSKLQALSDSAVALKSAGELSLFNTQSTNEDAATVSAGADALPGAYSLNVTKLASAQSHAFLTPFADKDTSTFGDGNIDITVGGNTTQVSISPSDTLENVRDKINSADAGVKANVIYDGSDYQLVVTSEDTGVANQFTLTASGFDDPGETDIFATGTSLDDGFDAEFTINGLPVTSSSNQVSTAVDGLTFELEGIGSAELSIERDTTGIGDRIQETLDAYNDVLDFINAQGDSSDISLRGIKNQLYNATQTVLDSGSFDLVALSQIGAKTDAAGHLQLNRTSFESALANDFNDVVELFTGKEGGAEGLASVFEKILVGDGTNAGILSPGDGTLQVRQNTFSDRLRSLDRQITRAEERLAQSEAQLVRRFASFEQLTGQYQAQGSFLSSALSSF
ncbi:MAG: flagellar filament capping protein FliD [Planctomycetes bacterium]|nr:flagellar filament capping protein FliD [Planctomycetota bacterium]